MTIRAAVLVLVVGVCAPAHGAAANLYRPGAPSLVADPVARQVGDSLTILVYESSDASTSQRRGLTRASRLGASAGTGAGPGDRAELNLNRSFGGDGATSRRDRLVTQVSVRVVSVLANGDLEVAGRESLMINGEASEIEVSGRVRPIDIAPDNTVASSRLSGAVIRSEGAGFSSRAAQPGVLERLLNHLGLF